VSVIINLAAWAFVASAGRAGDAGLRRQGPGGNLRSLDCTWGQRQGGTCCPARSSPVGAFAEVAAALNHFLLSLGL
jgi:hypothetical protein